MICKGMSNARRISLVGSSNFEDIDTLAFRNSRFIHMEWQSLHLMFMQVLVYKA